MRNTRFLIRGLSFLTVAVVVLAVAAGTPQASVAQKKGPVTPTFKLISPPLMQNVKPAWVFANARVEGPITTGTATYQVLPQYPQYTIPVTITRQKYWQRTNGPTIYPIKTTINNSVTITDAYSSTQTCAQRLSATVGAEGFGFKAELTAEVSSSLELQNSHSREETNSITQEIEAGTWIVDWTLMEKVTIKGSGTINLLPSSSILSFPITIDETYTFPLTTRRDAWRPVGKK